MTTLCKKSPLLVRVRIANSVIFKQNQMVDLKQQQQSFKHMHKRAYTFKKKLQSVLKVKYLIWLHLIRNTKTTCCQV